VATIFISYAHLDNKGGWVTGLHQALGIRLGELLGEQPVIWRDPRLDVGDVVQEALDQRLADADILLTVISPSYLNSCWCRKELEEFCNSAQQKGGVTVGNKSRIVKVVKLPVNREDLAHYLQSTLDGEFYRVEPETDLPVTVDPTISPTDFDRALNRFCAGIKNLIEHLKICRPDSKRNKTVYLAADSSDRGADRKNIKSELKQHGYSVLPTAELKGTASEIEKEGREQLRGAKLSVHLIGSFYGLIPAGGRGRSLERLQHDLAMERNADPDFKRLVWMPGELAVDEGETQQQEFIRYLREDHAVQGGAELLFGKLEDVKTRIHELLEREPAQAKDGRDKASVYLVYDRTDYDDVKPLEDFLYDQEIEVMPPPIGGDAAQVMQLHQESLTFCDALLVYYNRVGDIWAQQKRLEMLKLQGLVRPKPILARAFYISGEKTPQKERFRSAEVLVIKNYNGFLPDSLTPFLNLLRQAKGGQR